MFAAVVKCITKNKLSLKKIRIAMLYWRAVKKSIINRLIHDHTEESSLHFTSCDWRCLSNRSWLYGQYNVHTYNSREKFTHYLLFFYTLPSRTTPMMNFLLTKYTKCYSLLSLNTNSHRVSEKPVPVLFLNNSVKHWPTSIIFDLQHQEETWRKWL